MESGDMLPKNKTYNGLYELDTLFDDVLDGFYASNLNGIEKEDFITEIEEFNDWFLNASIIF